MLPHLPSFQSTNYLECTPPPEDAINGRKTFAVSYWALTSAQLVTKLLPTGCHAPPTARREMRYAKTHQFGFRIVDATGETKGVETRIGVGQHLA